MQCMREIDQVKSITRKDSKICLFSALFLLHNLLTRHMNRKLKGTECSQGNIDGKQKKANYKHKLKRASRLDLRKTKGKNAYFTFSLTPCLQK